MDNSLVSIIVPIYMIDKYLGTCIESIINQTYKNIEIILVDDGSKDRCSELCDLYAKKDERIKVIHKKNGGLVSARKAGLRESSGYYVTYVDGDDWVGSGYVESMYSVAVETGADIVCAGQTRSLFTKSSRIINSIPTGTYEGEKIEELWHSMISCGDYYKPGIQTYVWNKLFKREMLLDPQMLVDERITIGEDAAVAYPALLKCKKVVVTDNVAYHYRQREDSMLKQSASYFEEAKKIKYLYDYMIEWSKKANCSKQLKKQIVDYVLSIAIMRSGGNIPGKGVTVYDERFKGKNIVVYSAGTFGQQLVNRIKESKTCNIVKWIDDDYWEYRRCCLDVDSVDTVVGIDYDYIMIATVDSNLDLKIKDRLYDLGISPSKILSVDVSEDREDLLESFLSIIDDKTMIKKRSEISHA